MSESGEHNISKLLFARVHVTRLAITMVIIFTVTIAIVLGWFRVVALGMVRQVTFPAKKKNNKNNEDEKHNVCTQIIIA